MGKYTLIISLVLVIFSCNVAFGRYSGGTGEPNEPYRIATPEDLNDIRNYPEDFNDCFILVNDINMAGYSYTTALIAPDTNNTIGGFQGTDFSGVFDGNDCTVFSLTIDDGNNGHDYLGLFGLLNEGAYVKNVSIEDVYVDGGDSWYIGGLCGENKKGTIESCCASGTIAGGEDSVCIGGLCGGNNSYATTISNCHSACEVTGNSYVGGLCGGNISTIENCYSTGDVTGGDYSSYFGGLCGTNSFGTIENCYSNGDVTSGDNSEKIGGLCGWNWEVGTISNCEATGSVTGGVSSDALGGLCGANDSDCTIKNSTASGRVAGSDDSWYIGGLCGWNDDGTIINCYAVGDVNGVIYVGGLIGDDDNGEYTASFWDMEVNPDVNGFGDGTNEPNVMGRTTGQMQSESTFTDYGWDFVGESINGPNDVWTIKEGFKYPEHIWPIVQFVDWDGVDFRDYSHFSDWWRVTDCNEKEDCNGVDLDYSGEVDANDLDIFGTYWLWGK